MCIRDRGELNYPPDFPKMPGEPPRVQPSKKNEANWDGDRKIAGGPSRPGRQG